MNCNLGYDPETLKWVGFPRDVDQGSGTLIYLKTAGYKGRIYRPNHYAVEGNNTLRIIAARLNDGGWYECRAGIDTYKANVVVVGEYFYWLDTH